MTLSVLFHVVDCMTSYNMLLGRSYLHDNNVVSLILYQCLKYVSNGIVKNVVTMTSLSLKLKHILQMPSSIHKVRPTLSMNY